MSENPGEVQPAPASGVNESLLAMLMCLHESVPDVCSYGLTVGSSYVPFDADPDDGCDEGEDDPSCSQLWLRVVSSNPLSVGSPGWTGDYCSFDMRITLEVGVLRCYVIPEDGEAPMASDTMAATFAHVEDMYALLNAALCCDVWESIDVGQWTPLGPQGGQVGGTWTFVVAPK